MGKMRGSPLCTSKAIVKIFPMALQYISRRDLDEGFKLETNFGMDESPLAAGTCITLHGRYDGRKI